MLSFIPVLLDEQPEAQTGGPGLISKPEFLANCPLPFPMESVFASHTSLYRPTPALPGHEHGGIHRGRIVLPSRDLVVAEVPGSSILLVLPVTEALQGPLTMVANGQLGLREIRRRVVKEPKAQDSQSPCPDHSVDVKVEMAAL